MAERVDLEAVQARLDAANDDSGPWHIEPDCVDADDNTVGVWIESLGDGPMPGKATALFLREVREDVANLVAELRVLLARYGKDGEVWCGARRDQAGTAYCVEMAGHEQDGVPHMWHEIEVA